MSFLTVNGARLAYRTFGNGPALLAPECNYSWTPEFEALMGRHFTLVVASPRDFGASTRTGAPSDSNLWASDMLSVMQHLGHETFSVFGYSFTGASFYRDLSSLRPDALVDQSPCPPYCFWGDRDVDAVEVVMPHADLAEGLTRRGVMWKEYPGLDHESLNADLAVAWPDVERWLLSQVGNSQ